MDLSNWIFFIWGTEETLKVECWCSKKNKIKIKDKNKTVKQCEKDEYCVKKSCLKLSSKALKKSQNFAKSTK